MLYNSRIFSLCFIIFSTLFLISAGCTKIREFNNFSENIDSVDVARVNDAYLLNTGVLTSRNELVSFTNITTTSGLSGISGNFFAWGDYNNDGFQDLLINGGRLFRNNGLPDYTFTEVTHLTGISGSGNGAWADYDNDGYLDFYCTGTDTLWHNTGAPDYNFEDSTIDAGLERDEYPTTAIGWGDYDLDGYLDMYITNGEDYNDGNPIYFPDFLWHNNGDGTFSNVTLSSGIRNFGGPYYGRGVSWGDYDNDGWPDIYISNYRISPNWLFHNNRNGTFTDIALEKGVAGEESQRMGTTYYAHTVGSAWADLDNDGDLDLFESDLAHKDLYRGPICGDSQLYRNDGPANEYSFTDVRASSGIPEKNIGGGEDELYVGIAIADFDNDGFQDLFIPQIYDLEYSYSYLYRNNGDWTFTNVSDIVGVLVWNTYGGAWCDYNNDGFLDLVTGGKGTAEPNASYEVHLYRNNGNTNSWLHIKLVGHYFNKNAVGVRVRAIAENGLVQVRELEGGMGCHSSQNSMTLEFGFGSYSGTVDLEVIWPSGFIQKLENIGLNQYINIEETNQAPDLQLINVKVLESYPISGDPVTVEASVANMGYISAESANIKFFEGGPGELYGGREIGEEQQIYNLEKFHSTKVSTIWDTSGFYGELDIWAVIESEKPKEIVINNNAMNTSIDIRSTNQPPVARLTVTPINNVYTGDILYFNGANSTDDIAVEFYFFDFGDGNSSNWISNSEIYYQYHSSGKFVVKLMVKDIDDELSTTPAQITLTIKSYAPPNRAPVIDRFTANPMEVYVSETVNLKVIASDPDFDELIYYYSADAGELTSNEHSSIATWHAPAMVGIYTINAQVFDGELYSELVKIEINVIEEQKNKLPVIDEILVSPTLVYTNLEVTIKVLAMDPDTNDELSYTYEPTGGNILGSGATIIWKAPNEPDVYFIKVIVTDTRGLSADDEVMINVLERSYSPKVIDGLVNPSIIKNDKPNSVLFSVNIEDENGLDDIYKVTIDLSPLGGDKDQEMVDNGKFGDITGNDGYYSYEHLVSGGIAAGEKVLKVTVKDYQGNEETYNLKLTIEKGKQNNESSSAFTSGFEGILLIVCAFSIVIFINISKKRK